MNYSFEIGSKYFLTCSSTKPKIQANNKTPSSVFFSVKILKKLKATIKKILFFIFRLLPLHKHTLLFESNCDLSDSSYALFTYVRKNYPRYKCVWLLSDESSKKICESMKVKFAMQSTIKSMYYLKTCKCFFFTHRKLIVTPPRKGQKFYNLWHGSPLKKFNGKLIDNNVNKSIFVTQTEYTLKLYIDNYNINKEFSMLSNHLRNDFFYSGFCSEETKKVEDYFKFSRHQKNIIFLPTFRRPNEKSFDFFDNFPLSLTPDEFKSLDDFLVENDVQLIIKLHPMAVNADVSFRNKFKNIKIVTSKELVELNMQLYSIIGHCDALLSDFSSVVFDFMALDRPIGYVLADFESFKNNETEGFIFSDDIENYFVGDKIFNLVDLENFVKKVLDGQDTFASERRELAKKYVDMKCQSGKNSENFCKIINL